MNRILISTAGALALMAGAAQAQSIADEANGVTVLDTLVVVAGREPLSAGKSARALTVVSGEEIEERQVKTVADALRQVPGLAVSDVGGQTFVRIRGAEANQVLVMIDGVETAATPDGFDFASLPADQIERIEVLRGPQSALWGAGATSGVVNIVTRGGMRNGKAFETFVEGGSNGSFASGMSARGGTADADFALGVVYRKEAGWDQSDSGGDDDGFRNLSVTGKANIDLTDDLTLRLSGRLADRLVEFDDGAGFGCGSPSCYLVDSADHTKGRDIMFGASADYRSLGGALVSTPSFSYSSRDDHLQGTGWSVDTEVSTLKAGHQAAYTFGDADQHKVIGAAEFKRETFRSSSAGSDLKTRDQFGTVLEYRGDITDRLFVQLGARHDWNDDFANATTWSASAAYSIHETGTRLHASVGRGVTNPTFFELYGFMPGQFVGNPNLLPEENTGFDIGIEQTFLDGRFVADVTYFNETLRNKITGSGLTVVNLPGKSDREGVELALTVRPIDTLSIRASYTYLDATEADGTPEVRRPRHSAGLNVVQTFLEGRAKIGADVTFNGSRHDRDFSDASFTAPKRAMDDYVKVDIFGSYQVNENFELYGRVANLFDADYQEAIGYATQPTTAYFGVKGRF